VFALWAWGWLAIVHLVLDLFAAVPFLVVLSLLIAGVSAVPAFLVGVPLAALALVIAMWFAKLERLRLHAFTGVRIQAPPAPPRDQATWKRLLLDLRPWRASAYLALVSLWGLLAGTAVLVLTCVVLGLSAVPLYRGALPDGVFALPFGGELSSTAWLWLTVTGLAGLVVLPLVARGLVAVDMSVGRLLLGRSHREEVQQLSERVETLTQTRVATVDSVEVERRRIERDLHDGPQQRLVAIAMDLGMAREKLGSDPVGVRELLDRAHASAKEAITEMRQVARGIAPPVLTDRGLDAALSALAARAPVPVHVQVVVPRRPSPTIEAIAYFCVSEALTNVAKHAHATSVRVEVTSSEDYLTIRVSDDGAGGADSRRGTGLSGLRDRVRAVDGTLDVASVPGHGTVLTAVLPTSRPGAPQQPGHNPYRAPSPGAPVAPGAFGARPTSPPPDRSTS
jgi:signal transduction histidine kinase